MKECNSRRLTLIEVVLFGVLGGMMFALKVAMSGLPNIEPVSLLVMVYAVVFGWKCLYPIYVYVLMEILLFGIGTWNLNYLYIWAILAFGAISLRQMKNPLAWAVLSGAYGLLFGLFCAPVDVFVGGFGFAVSKWASGIPFDLAHGGGNFVIALILFAPIRKLLERLYSQIKR